MEKNYTLLEVNWQTGFLVLLTVLLAIRHFVFKYCTNLTMQSVMSQKQK